MTHAAVDPHFKEPRMQQFRALVYLFTLGIAFVRMNIGVAIVSVSPLCLKGELAEAVKRNELVVIDVTHLIGSEKIFFVSKRTRESLPQIVALRDLLGQLCAESY